MDELDFTLELNSDHLSKEEEYALFTEAEAQLKGLAEGHTDLTGAAVSIRQVAARESSPLHEVTVVVYGRPENMAATKKNVAPPQALKEALDAVERQVREKRERLSKKWEQPGNHPTEQEINEVMRAEFNVDEVKESSEEV